MIVPGCVSSKSNTLAASALRNAAVRQSARARVPISTASDGPENGNVAARMRPTPSSPLPPSAVPITLNTDRIASQRAAAGMSSGREATMKRASVREIMVVGFPAGRRLDGNPRAVASACRRWLAYAY